MNSMACQDRPEEVKHNLALTRNASRYKRECLQRTSVYKVEIVGVAWINSEDNNEYLQATVYSDIYAALDGAIEPTFRSKYVDVWAPKVGIPVKGRQ